MPDNNIKSDPTLGLCLGGGGGLGLLHIGLIETLEELGIRPGVVAGCSSGSVIGALYCAGKTSSELREIFKDFTWARIVAPTIPMKGFLSTRRMEGFYRKHLGEIDISDLPIPLKIAAVDLHSGELMGFTRGPLPRCLAASSAIPGVFEPVKINNRSYYDPGGMFNLPLEFLSGLGLKTIIAANTIGETGLMKRPRTVQDVLFQAYMIRCRQLVRWRVGERGWEGKKDEKLILIDYDTGGANPASLGECKTMIENTRKLALEVLGREFG